MDQGHYQPFYSAYQLCSPYQPFCSAYQLCSPYQPCVNWCLGGFVYVGTAYTHSVPRKAAFSMQQHSRSYSTARYVGWELPTPGITKLNVDGSSRGNPGESGAGGLLRDSEGSYICGFTSNIGIATSVEAELVGIRDGLRMAWDREIPSLMVETDSLKAISLIKVADTQTHPLGTLIDDCREYLSRSWNIALCHTPREGNRCADFMSKLSHASTDSFKLFSSPPSELLPLLADDTAGVLFLRP